MEAVGLDLGGNINYLQDLAVSADGSNLLDIIDQNVPGYHRVTKTDPFQDPMDDEPFCCMHRQQFLTSVSGVGIGLGSVTSAMCETVSLDLSPNITEDFQKMYSDWQQHLGSLQASEEEDLVVDEVVSLSMSTRNGGNTHTGTSVICARQRTESVSSLTGPCVPPDLLLDIGTRRVSENECADEVQQEDILTEIAGVLDGDLPLEECAIIPDDDIISAPQVNGDTENVLKVSQNEGAVLEEAAEKEELVNPCPESQEERNESLEETEVVVKSKELQTVGGFRNVADLIGNQSQSLICKKIKSTQCLQEKTVRIDGKDVKLRTGSIILAVVNEAGSLVPLPQLKMKNQKIAPAIKVVESSEKNIEEEIDVETVTEKAPVLEAGDVDSLLAQFEASEAVNTPSLENSNVKRKNNTNCQLKAVPSTIKIGRQALISSSGTTTSTKCNSPQTSSPTHQKIKAALPKEIIEKIKASTKRKSTQMLSEPIVIRKGRGIRQQEVKQHRSKGHRTPSSTSAQQNSSDQRVPPPLDHDYCCSPDKLLEKQKKGKSSNDNASQNEEYLNKLPDYYTTKVSKRDGKKTINTHDDNQDDNGKKDSGVESGNVSDASVETEDRKKDRTIKSDRSSRDEWDKGKTVEVITVEKSSEDVYNKLPPYMTDIGNSKPKDDCKEGAEKEEEECEDKEEKEECEDKEEKEKQEVKKIKKKLKLSEYRQRVLSAQSSRCPSPAQTDAMPKTSNSSPPISVGDLIQKMKEAEEKSKELTNSVVPEKKSADSTLPVEDVEEGELKGDSDQEITYKNSNTSVCVNSKSEKHKDGRKEKRTPFTSPSSLNNSTNSNSRQRRKNSSHGYGSRRWSSSSHSRSRSRSPHGRKLHHSSRSSRSSRSKRKACNHSRSSVSPCWSRSRSRSRTRSRGSSSESSYCSCCSCNSRSRSHSDKKRERRGYTRRYSGNRGRSRRSHSRSRSLSRYSRSRSSSHYNRSRRSRTPTWRNSNHSRSPHRRRPVIPRRREDENRVKQVEERRVIYVGRISDGTSKSDLRRRFDKFGSIVDISVHFREHGDNYGFVTFKDKDQAYNAVEHGNDDPSYSRYDLCFGGRRAFCRVQYSDLDAQDEYIGMSSSSSCSKGRTTVAVEEDFDTLLRDALNRAPR